MHSQCSCSHYPSFTPQPSLIAQAIHHHKSGKQEGWEGGHTRISLSTNRHTSLTWPPAGPPRSIVLLHSCSIIPLNTPSHPLTHRHTPSHPLRHPHIPSHPLASPHISHTITSPHTPSYPLTPLTHPLIPSHALTSPHTFILLTSPHTPSHPLTHHHIPSALTLPLLYMQKPTCLWYHRTPVCMYRKK